MRTPKGKSGIEMFREYFQRQQSTPLSPAEQCVMTHIIWLMNENFSEEVQITLRQLSARCNVDIRTLKAKLPQLCDKNYLTCAEISGDVCTLVYKNARKNEMYTSNSTPNKLINKGNIINPDFKGGNVNEGFNVQLGGTSQRISLRDIRDDL